jgi:hypothetical protein
MKTGIALWCALSLLLGSVAHPAFVTPADAPVPATPAPTSIITPDDQFFVDHPDLKDEAEVVDEVSKQLAAEGYTASTAPEAAEALAAKSRASLAERTPAEWQQKAVSLFPELGVKGSEFNALFVKHYQELKVSSPDFTKEPSWPVLLAKRCDDELRGRSPVAARAAAPSSASSAAAAPAQQPGERSQKHRSSGFWQTFFGLLLLIMLTVLPCAVAFRPEVLTLSPEALGIRSGALTLRKGRKPSREPSNPMPALRGDKGDSPVWRVALKHAAIIYAVVALPASIHSLMANSDLGFIDRLFVSLLVGALIGLFIALPLYGVDALWHAYQKHTPRHAAR